MSHDIGLCAHLLFGTLSPGKSKGLKVTQLFPEEGEQLLYLALPVFVPCSQPSQSHGVSLRLHSVCMVLPPHGTLYGMGTGNESALPVPAAGNLGLVLPKDLTKWTTDKVRKGRLSLLL